MSLNQWSNHCVKSVHIRSLSGLHFPAFGAFGPNREIYSVNLHIQSKCGKIRTTKNPNTDTFYTMSSDCLNKLIAESEHGYVRSGWSLHTYICRNFINITHPYQPLHYVLIIFTFKACQCCQHNGRVSSLKLSS